MAEADVTRACVVCAYCGAEFIKRGKRAYCSDDHARLAKLRRDRERDVTPEQRAARNAKYYASSHATIRGRDNAYKARVRAERGRGDRSNEYLSRRIRLGKSNAWLWSKAHRIVSRLVEMAPVGAAKSARLIAKADNHLAHMSGADQWRWKYRNDPEFRQSQIQRLKAQKIKRKQKTEHGMTKAEVLAIYAERSSCLYCGCRLEGRAKVLDHMDPLSKGGAHDASNLVVACGSCNARKAAKLFIDWLPLVVESRRTMVAKVYAKKHGAPVEQGGLMLVMRAA